MASSSLIQILGDDFPLNTPMKYTPKISPEFLALTKTKLSLARYPEEQVDFADDDWTQGAKVKEVRRLAEFWEMEYKWEATEVRKAISIGANIVTVCLHCNRQRSISLITILSKWMSPDMDR